jgi:hypothetical protein
MAAGFIKEVFHPEWLANPVLVRKKGGEMADVCRLHWSQQSVSEGSLPSVTPLVLLQLKLEHGIISIGIAYV